MSNITVINFYFLLYILLRFFCNIVEFLTFLVKQILPEDYSHYLGQFVRFNYSYYKVIATSPEGLSLEERGTKKVLRNIPPGSVKMVEEWQVLLAEIEELQASIAEKSSRLKNKEVDDDSWLFE